MPKTAADEGALRTFVAQVSFSGIVLVAALYVILSSGYDADAQKWASGIVGLVMGYWFK